jgi:hydrogenase maturation factor
MSDAERRHLGGPERELAPLIGQSCAPDADGRCATCADEALPARVLRVDPAAGLALVAMRDTTVEVDITLVDEVAPGALLLIHGGVAIAHLGEAAAVPSAGA